MGRRRTNSLVLGYHVNQSWSVIGPMLHLIRVRLLIHLHSSYQGHVDQMALQQVLQAIQQLLFDQSSSKYYQFRPNDPIFVVLFLHYQLTLYFHPQMNFLINQLLLLYLFLIQLFDRKWLTGSRLDRSVHIENGRNEELLLTYFCARMIKQIKHAFYVLIFSSLSYKSSTGFRGFSWFIS